GGFFVVWVVGCVVWWCFVWVGGVVGCFFVFVVGVVFVVGWVGCFGVFVGFLVVVVGGVLVGLVCWVFVLGVGFGGVGFFLC
ncbi:hypothetical protein DVA80_21095, partial [Acinetobacter baumannii]|uniref:hypothetical protein n=1 Tax=Acinetobacter baumannii TaxID=470 RepID=UPI000E055EC1